MCLIKLKNGATVSTHKSLILNKIHIKIKTFHGSRKVHIIETNIGETIDNLREKLLKADTDHELSKFKQIKLIYTIVIFKFL